jgi:hypothetical protein
MYSAILLNKKISEFVGGASSPSPPSPSPSSQSLYNLENNNNHMI